MTELLAWISLNPIMTIILAGFAAGIVKMPLDFELNRRLLKAAQDKEG